MSDRARAQRQRLAEPAFARLWHRARRRLERAPDDLPVATVRLSDPTETERAAIAGLLGRPLRGRALAIPLTELDAVLRAGPAGISLVELLEALGGPLRDRPRERAERARRIEAALGRARTGRHAGQPWFEDWLGALERAGLLARMERQGELDLLDAAVRVLDELPAPRRPLPSLAAAVTGDTKALDAGPLATLVLRALTRWAGAEPPRSADERRELWARFGVLLDDLAATVLVLNLWPAPGRGLAGWLREAAADGTPFRLTLHQLERYPLRFDPAPVFVCENPAVLRAAAERLGAASRPLVCVEGQPSTAFLRLGEALRAAGAPLRYHGDFDWPGLQIAAGVMARTGATPWHLTADDYRAAAARLPRETDRLAGDPVVAPWDSGLAPAMAADGRVVYEEMVLDDLLRDLAGE